jgi:suppressor of fused
MEEDMNDEPDTSGWAAIDALLKPIYGDAKPHHWGTVRPASLGGNDPLEGISAYQSSFGGRPHWHFITYGFTELYTKESDDPDVSGYGFELSVRVVDPKFENEPPMWVLGLLQNLARYVFRTGNFFSSGDHTTLNGKIAFERETGTCQRE